MEGVYGEREKLSLERRLFNYLRRVTLTRKRRARASPSWVGVLRNVGTCGFGALVLQLHVFSRRHQNNELDRMLSTFSCHAHYDEHDGVLPAFSYPGQYD